MSASVIIATPEQLATIVREQLEDVLAEMQPTTARQETLLDRAGAAKFLAVSLAQLDLLCRRENDPIPFGLAGDCRRFEREELRAWVRRQRGGSR